MDEVLDEIKRLASKMKSMYKKEIFRVKEKFPS